jgi:hypothetical protein
MHTGRGSSLVDGKQMQTETVRKMARGVLDMTDAKSYLLDAMNVKIPGVPWTDPTPRRNWRHDSKLHSPFGERSPVCVIRHFNAFRLPSVFQDGLFAVL